jgi:hypothetical protein
MKTCVRLWEYLAEFFSEWEMFQTKVVEKIKSHVLSSVTFFFKSYRVWDNVEKYGRTGQATNNDIIRRMRFACWITKVTNTLRIYNTYCFSTATTVSRKHLYFTRFVCVVEI